LAGKGIKQHVSKAAKQGVHMLNEEKLWCTYHELVISTFQQKWENFPSTKNLPKEPMLY